jgi:rare lipoprotein A (peptidoglycan hydrolase)
LPPTTSTTSPPTTTTTTRPVPTTTTTTRPARTNSEVGDATWYAAAPAGYCASPTLPFGTVLTVVNNATDASTVCTVDDREEAGYPRVVDLSPEGFSQIADTNRGVVDVTISW